MEEALKKFTDDFVTEYKAWLEGQEVRDVIEATNKAADGDTGTFEIVITTENLDRYQDVIKADAWDLTHYMKNPVVLWGHDHKTLPIGVTTEIIEKDGKKIARGKFAPHEFAQTIRKLYDMGVLRAASVGFIEKEREGNLITKAELIEWSIVSVPANPYCLSTLVKSGVNVNEMVTKGFVTIKEADATEEEEEEEVEEEIEEPNLERSEEEKAAQHEELRNALATMVKQERAKAFLSETITRLRDAAAALEDLAAEGQEPEGNEAPQETDEEKAYREFSDKRRKLQEAATVLGAVLAETRQAIEARK